MAAVTSSLCVFFDMEHLLTSGVFHVTENTEGGCTAATSPVPPVSRCSMSKKTQREDVTAATSPTPPVSRCSMSKKTEREDVPLPQAQPHLSVDVPCQRKHRGRRYRCHKPHPTCQQNGACGSGTSSLCVFFDMEHLLTGGAGLVAAVHPPSLFSLTGNIYCQVGLGMWHRYILPLCFL